MFRNSQAAYREEVTSPPCKPLNHSVLESLCCDNLQFLVSQERETAQKYLSESIMLSYEPVCLLNQSAVTINGRLRLSEPAIIFTV